MKRRVAVVLLLCFLLLGFLPLKAMAASMDLPQEPYEKVAAKKGSWYAEQINYDGKSNLVVGYKGGYTTLAEKPQLAFQLTDKMRISGVYVPYAGANSGAVELKITDSFGNVYQDFSGKPTTTGSLRDTSDTGDASADEINTLFAFLPQQEIVLPKGSYTLQLAGNALPVDAFLVKGHYAAAYDDYLAKLRKLTDDRKTADQEASYGEEDLLELLKQFQENRPQDYTSPWGDVPAQLVAPMFALETEHVVDKIILHTWNNGAGALPGTVFILDEDGNEVGVYFAQGARLGNVANAMWVVTPSLVLPAGVYYIDMDDPEALTFTEEGEPVFYVGASLPVRQTFSYTGTYRINLDVYKTSTLMGPVDEASSSFSMQDFELTILDKGPFIELIGKYEGMPFSQNCEVTERGDDFLTARFDFTADLTKLPYKAKITAQAVVTLTKPAVGMARISMDGTGTYERAASAGKGADFNTYRVEVQGEMVSRSLPPFIMTALGNLGGAGNIPGPDSPAEAAAGMLFPPLAGVLVHILQEKLKQRQKATVRDKKWYMKKYPGRTEQEIAIIMMADALGASGGDPEDAVSVGDNESSAPAETGSGADYGYDGDGYGSEEEDYSFGKPDVTDQPLGPRETGYTNQSETQSPAPEMSAEPESMVVTTSQHGAETLIVKDPTTGGWVNAETGNPFDLEKHRRESPGQFQEAREFSARQTELERSGQTAMQKGLDEIRQKYTEDFNEVQKEINSRKMEQLKRDQAWAEWEQAQAQKGAGWGRIVGDTVKNAGDEIVDAGKTIGREAAQLGRDALEAGKDIWNDPSILTNTIKGTRDDIQKGLDSLEKSLVQAGKDIYRNPEIVIDTLKETGKDLARGAVNATKAVIETVTDPKKAWDYVKNTTGIDNFGNALDPNRSLLNRIGQVAIGTGKLASTLATAGKAGVAIKSSAGKLAGIVDDLVLAGSKKLPGKAAVTGIRTTLPVKSGPGYVGAGKPANLSGVTSTSQKIIQNTADDFGVQIHTRHTTPQAEAWLSSGKAVAKDADMKAKTLKKIDELLGGPKDAEGLVGYYKPKLPPKDVMRTLSPETQQEIVKTFKERSREFNKLATDIQRLESEGKYKVVDGLVMDLKRGGKYITGDVDALDITNFDGSPVSAGLKKQVIDSMTKKTGSNLMHGDVMSWTKDDSAFNLEAKVKMLNNARSGGDGITTYNPLNAPTANYQSGSKIDLAQVRNYLKGEKVDLPPDQMADFLKILKDSGLEV